MNLNIEAFQRVNNAEIICGLLCSVSLIIYRNNPSCLPSGSIIKSSTLHTISNRAYSESPYRSFLKDEQC